MPLDPRSLKPGELCRLLNSTSLGEVISERQLHRHRTRAGYRIGDGKTVDLLRYTAWLVIERHEHLAVENATEDGAFDENVDAMRTRDLPESLTGRDIDALPEIINPRRKEACRRNFRLFCETYFPQTFHLAWSPDHLKVIARKRGDRIGLNWRIPVITGKRAVRHVVFDTNYWKSFVQARLAVVMGDPGCLSLFGKSVVRSLERGAKGTAAAGRPGSRLQSPDSRLGSHQLLAEHLTSEYRVKTQGRGRTVDEWKLRVDGLDNHWLDCLVGCAVSASMHGAVLYGTDTRPAPRRRIRLSDLQGGLRR